MLSTGFSSRIAARVGRSAIAVGAHQVIRLTDDADATGQALAAAAADVDIVIDYLWGKPAEQAIMALLRPDPTAAGS